MDNNCLFWSTNSTNRNANTVIYTNIRSWYLQVTSPSRCEWAIWANFWWSKVCCCRMQWETFSSQWEAGPVNTKRRTNVGTMLAQRRRRWASIIPTLNSCLSLKGQNAYLSLYYKENHSPCPVCEWSTLSCLIHPARPASAATCSISLTKSKHISHGGKRTC